MKRGLETRIGLRALALAVVVGAAAPASADRALDAKAQRGRDLHDMTCKGCHDDDMYVRRERSHNPYFDVRRQTRLWLLTMDITWTEQELDEVVHYLRQRFYSVE